MNCLRFAAWLMTVALLVAGGCQQQAPLTATVSLSGTVSLDGTPLRAGTITFIPLGRSEGITVEIKQGSFRVEKDVRLPAGRNRVEVRDADNRVPARYNAESTLISDIVPGQDKLDFRLSSKQ